MTQPARIRLLAASALIATSVTALAALSVGTSSAAEPYTATGTLSAPAASSASDAEFTMTCPEMPSNQGVDAYVFELPADVATAGTRVTVTSSQSTYQMRAYVYQADCTYLEGTVDEDAGTGYARTLAAGDRYLSVYTNTFGLGFPMTLTLTAAPAQAPSPTASATASASASPTATESPSSAPTVRRAYDGTPNDPLFMQDGAGSLFFNGQWGMRKIQAPAAWQETRATGAGVNVAVLDTGLDLGHPDFACDGKVAVVPGADPDDDGKTVPEDDVDGHGTHVAGIIGACTDNATGVVGVAPDATLMPVQVLSPTATAADLASGIRTAADSGAHVINMSLGFAASDPYGVVSVPGSGSLLSLFGFMADIDTAIEYAVSKGVVVVAAAGNESASVCGYPALAEDVVCVGATDPNDVNSWYSNFPLTLDNEDVVGIGLMAPGGRGVPDCGWSSSEILSTYARAVDKAEDDCDGLAGYASIQGTSMAAPHVAGLAALVYDRLGGARSPENRVKVQEAMVETAVDLYGPGYDPASGYGRIDALGAVRYWPAAAVETASPTASPSVSTSPSPSVRSTSVAFTANTASSGDFSDRATLAATLTDDSGLPMANRTLTFQLLGRDGFREMTAVTDATGAASVELVLDAPPGAYDVGVGFAGEQDAYRSSADRRPFTVVAESTTTTLSVAGSGSKKTLTATVVDADDASRGIAGVAVDFYEGTDVIGRVTTNADGVAVHTPPSGSKGASRTYRAAWAGDRFHTGSSS